ncbi:MAG: ABC transporter substrate-binding protein [Chloroflexi bacterium]|nr:ABC transporter substrate-binding protein [Chloroflexota bacterium]
MQRQVWKLLGSLVVLGMLLAGCAPAATPGPTAKAAPPAAKAPAAQTPAAQPAAPAPTPKPGAEQPRSGGMLTIGIAVETASFDPHAETSYPALTATQPAMNGILEADPLDITWKVRPALAESWEASADGLSYTFKMRKDVKFHDGSPFTSADAKATVDRVRFPPRGLVVAIGNYFEAIEKTETPDPGILVIRLKNRFAPLISFLAMGQMVVFQKQVVDRLGGSKLNKIPDAVGTGPFKLQEWSPGVGWLVVKNQNYWKKGQPYLDGVRHFLLVDRAARYAAFRTGRVLALQKSPNVPPTDIEVLKTSVPDLTISSGTSNGAWFLFMNVTKEPFTDKRVRQAAHLAIDRQKIKKIAFQGDGQIGLLVLAPYRPKMGGVPEEQVVKMPGFRQPKDADITEAKRLLAQAGHPDGFDLPILMRTGSEHERFGTLLIDDFKKIGVRAKLEQVDVSSFYDRSAKGLAAAMAGFGVPEVPDPHAHMGLHRPTGRNYSHWENKRYEELYVLQQQASDEAQRIKYLKEAEALAMEELPAASTIWEFRNIVMWPQVKNWGYGPVSYIGQRFDEVWLAK